MNVLSNARKHFPFFRLNPEIAYLDYAATTFMPDQALNAWLSYQQNIGISEGRNNSVLGVEAAEVLQRARKTIKAFFNFGESHELIFVKNATEALNVVAWGLGKQLQPGDLVALSALEHHSNYLPWQRLVSMRKGQIIELPLTCGLPDIDILEKYLNNRLRIVTITHTSNVTGAQPDIGKTVELAASAGAFSVLDATQASAHNHLESTVFKFDCVAVSAHKMYGPRNIGGLFVRKSLLPIFEPFMLGGGMVWRTGISPSWLEDHRRLEAGTFDPGLALAWEESCKFLETEGLDNIAKAEKELGSYLRNRLSDAGMTLLSNPYSASLSIVSFIHPSLHPHDLEERLSKSGVIIRSGHLCAQNALQHLGILAINRASIGLGVNKDQIDHLLEILPKYSKKTLPKKIQTEFFSDTEIFLEKLVNDRQGHIIISPDVVLVSDGIACGDAIILEVNNTEGKCNFNCSVKGCFYCRASAALMEKLNNFAASEIIEYVHDFINFIDNGVFPENFPLAIEDWQKWNYPKSRKECILAPWRLLAGVNWNCHTVSKTSSPHIPLACKACVSANKIEWNKKTPPKQASWLREFID